MATARLDVIIDADGKQVIKTLAELEADLKKFGEELKKASNPADIARLNKALEETRKQINALKSFNGSGLNNLSKGSNSAAQSLTNLGRVAQDAPFGFIGIQNNLNPLLESFQQLKVQAGSNAGALKLLGRSLMGAGGLGLALSAVTAALSFATMGFGAWTRGLSGGKKDIDAAAEAAKKLKESIDGAFADAAREAADVNVLIAVLKSEVETRERKLQAVKELQKIQPEIFNGLKLEGNAVAGLDTAYKSYIQNLRTVIALDIKRAQLQQLIEKQLRLQGATLAGLDKRFFEGVQRFQKGIVAAGEGPGGKPTAGFETVTGAIKESQDEAKNLEKDIADLFSTIVELSKGAKLTIDKKASEKEADKAFRELIKRAEYYEKLINEKTIRIANFEFSPDEKRSDVIKKAEDFIQRALTDRGSFTLKFNISPIIDARQEFTKLQTDLQKAFDKVRLNAGKLDEQFRKELDELTKRNPVLIRARVELDKNKQRGAEAASALGLNIEGVNAPVSLLTNMQKEAINAANTVNSILTPAFEGLFDAIVAGENPIKAFFQSLGQAITQLLSRLLQAAVQAAIISAIFPGGAQLAGGFGGLFKNILGFRASGGPVIGGSPYVVGEQGPELFVPRGSGRVVSNQQLSNFVGNTGGGVTERLVAQISGRQLSLILAREHGYQNRNK